MPAETLSRVLAEQLHPAAQVIPALVNLNMPPTGLRRNQARCLRWVMCGRLRVGKDFLHVLQHWSVQPCVRPFDAVHMTAGHNALRGSGPGQKPAFDNAMALDCMSLPQMRRLTLDVATRVTRTGRAEPQTWRASRGPSYRSLCWNRYVKIA